MDELFLSLAPKLAGGAEPLKLAVYSRSIPSGVAPGVVQGAMADASIFQRATLACMEGRGYTVK